MDEEKIPVVYIAGVGRSGSTLLERTLAQLEDFVSIGELRFLWDKRIDIELCGCGLPFSECPFWSEVIKQSFDGFSNLPKKRIEYYRKKLEKNYLLPRMLINLGKPFDREMNEYSELTVRIYQTIAASTFKKIIIDSSKGLRKLNILRRNKKIDLTVIHLIRNPKGVVYSWTKKVKRPDVVGEEEYMPIYTPFRMAWHWLHVNIFMCLTYRLFTKYIRIRYEDFVANPESVIRTIMETLNLSETKFDFLKNNQLDLRLQNHSVSGNPFRFAKGKVEIKLDEEWKTNLPAVERLLISIFTWPLEFFFSTKKTVVYKKT